MAKIYISIYIGVILCAFLFLLWIKPLIILIIFSNVNVGRLEPVFQTNIINFRRPLKQHHQRPLQQPEEKRYWLDFAMKRTQKRQEKMNEWKNEQTFKLNPSKCIYIYVVDVIFYCLYCVTSILVFAVKRKIRTRPVWFFLSLHKIEHISLRYVLWWKEKKSALQIFEL